MKTKDFYEDFKSTVAGCRPEGGVTGRDLSFLGGVESFRDEEAGGVNTTEVFEVRSGDNLAFADSIKLWRSRTSS